MKSRCFLCSFVLILIFSSAGSGRALALDAAPQIGEHAPPFVLRDINGTTVSMAQDKGRVILLNFWASWCHACSAEMSSMNHLYNSLKNKGLEVFAISIDSSDKSLKSYVAKRAISFPVLFDRNGEGYFEQFGLIGLPATFLIDRRGIIVDKFLGTTDWDSPEIRSKILGLINSK